MPRRERKERQQLETVKPKVVADKGKDITAEDATGEPESKEDEAKGSRSGSAPPPAAGKVRATIQRIEMKHAVAEEEKKPVAKAKVMAEPKKRAGELCVDPPVAKVKPNSVQGTRRTAEVDVEKLEESADPFKNAPDSSKLPRDVWKVIRETYSVNDLEITVPRWLT